MSYTYFSGRFIQKRSGRSDVLSVRRYTYKVKGISALAIDYLQENGNEIFINMSTPVSENSKLTSIKLESEKMIPRDLLPKIRRIDNSTVTDAIVQHRKRTKDSETIDNFVESVLTKPKGEDNMNRFYFDETGATAYDSTNGAVIIKNGYSLKTNGKVYSLPAKRIQSKTVFETPESVLKTNTPHYFDNERVPYILVGTLPVIKYVSIDGDKTKTFSYPFNMADFNIFVLEPKVELELVMKRGKVDEEMVKFTNENIETILAEVKEKKEEGMMRTVRKFFGLSAE